MAVERQIIYTVMTCGKLEVDNNGFPDLGDTHLAGWFSDKDLAFVSVKGNACNINKTGYPYVIIEAVREGLYKPAMSGNRWFFKYIQDKNAYEEIPEPEGFEHMCGFTIG